MRPAKLSDVDVTVRIEKKRRDLQEQLAAIDRQRDAVSAALAKLDIAAEVLTDLGVDAAPAVGGEAVIETRRLRPVPERSDLPRERALDDKPVSVRIAALVLQQPGRTWQPRDLTALLFEDGSGSERRTRQESVRKALGRMVTRGHLARLDDGVYASTDRTGEALKE